MDPSGEFSVTIAGLTINISVGTFLATSAASYVFGKAFSAGYLLATEQSLKNFRWLEWSDLASFVPGGVVAGAFAKVTVLPVSLLAKTAGGKIVGQYLSKGGPAVAAAFRQTFARFGSKFTMRAADGTEVILEEGTEKIGFVHILQRHLAQFWDGTKVNKTTFVPTGTTQTDMLIMLKEAVEKANPAIIRSVRNLSGPMGQSVTLANGLTVKLVTLYKDGVFKVVTFFPEAGPGVTKAIDVVNLVT